MKAGKLQLATGAIPEDFCRWYHNEKEIKKTWLNGRGVAIDWVRELRTWWADRKATWTRRNVEDGQGAVRPAVLEQPWMAEREGRGNGRRAWWNWTKLIRIDPANADGEFFDRNASDEAKAEFVKLWEERRRLRKEIKAGEK